MYFVYRLTASDVYIPYQIIKLTGQRESQTANVKVCRYFHTNYSYTLPHKIYSLQFLQPFHFFGPECAICSCWCDKWIRTSSIHLWSQHAKTPMPITSDQTWYVAPFTNLAWNGFSMVTILSHARIVTFSMYVVIYMHWNLVQACITMYDLNQWNWLASYIGFTCIHIYARTHAGKSDHNSVLALSPDGRYIN